MTKIAQADGDQAIVDARMHVISKYGFFGPKLYEMDTQYDPACDTAYTDDKKIVIGPWVASLPNKQRAGVLMHELCHTIFGHIARRAMYIERGFGPDMKPFQPARYDKACDYLVNRILTTMGVDLPTNGLHDPTLDPTRTADSVYLDLPEEPDPSNQPNQPGDGPSAPGGWDTHGDPSQATPSEQQIQEQTTRDLAQMQAVAKEIGDIPGTLQRLFGELLSPKKHWRELLWDYVQNVAGRDMLSWRRPHRRKLIMPPNAVYPSTDGCQIGEVVIATDVSGSIGQAEFDAFMAEVREILETLRPRQLHLIWWDTRATCQNGTGLDMDDIQLLPIPGGGGTSYACVPELIQEMGLEPDIVLAFTDGYVAWPDADAILWPHLTVSTSHHDAPFGETIFLDLGT